MWRGFLSWCLNEGCALIQACQWETADEKSTNNDIKQRGDRTQDAHDAQMERGGSTQIRPQKSALQAQGGMTWLNTRCSTASMMERAGVIKCEHTQLASLSEVDIWVRKSVSHSECHSVNCLLIDIAMTYADTNRLISAQRSAWYATCMDASVDIKSILKAQKLEYTTQCSWMVMVCRSKVPLVLGSKASQSKRGFCLLGWGKGLETLGCF